MMAKVIGDYKGTIQFSNLFVPLSNILYTVSFFVFVLICCL